MFIDNFQAPINNSRAAVLTPAGNADTITNALGPFPNKGAHDLVYKAADSGFFSYNEPSCSGLGAGQSPGYGSAIIGATLKSVPIVGSFLSSVAGAFGAHHAAAVKREQATLCAEVPAFNDFLRTIDAAVQQGADTGEAIQSLEAAYSTFVSRLSGIFKQCNAACVYQKAARATIEKRKQDYALGVATNARAAQTVTGGVTSGPTVYGRMPQLTDRFSISQPDSLDPNAAPFNPQGGRVSNNSPINANATAAPSGVAAASIAGVSISPKMQMIALVIVGVGLSASLLIAALRRKK